ncbi:hypothetical protein GGI43DRAFT_424042 [Trichoderma evansii]
MSGSGFKIAGIVLHAFPLATNALEICRDTANQVGLFLQIKLEYKRWRDDLEYHKLVFTNNLRQLLLPLVLNDDKIRELLLVPGGDCWREEPVAELFEKRLGESYGLYMELAIDSDWAQKMLDDSQKTSNSKIRLKEFFARQFHKFKLSSNGIVRKRLFEELQDYNNKLEKLLKANEEDVHLLNSRNSKLESGNIDVVVCNFWKKAKSVFQALASVWACQCQQHGANLLLQHRLTSKADFNITLTGFISAECEFHRVWISEGEDKLLKDRHSKFLLPKKKAMKKPIEFSITQSPAALASVETSPNLPTANEIVNLCATLQTSEASCYGYLVEKECRYNVFNISRHNREAVQSMTLDQMLRGDISPQLTRSQRYNLSLILASTFLQLLDSPWISAFPKRSDIIFFSGHNGDTPIFRLDQPHINYNFKPSGIQNTAPSSEKMLRYTEALDHLGIMLLELCFGRIMEDQPWRKRLPAGANNQEKTGFDILAAREWQCDINGEAGGDYAEAVSWCLGGNRIAPLERWRQEMLRRVIQPLHRCHEYF